MAYLPVVQEFILTAMQESFSALAFCCDLKYDGVSHLGR